MTDNSNVQIDDEQIDDVSYQDLSDDMASDSVSKLKKKKKVKKESSSSKIIDVEDRERLLLSQLLSNPELFIKGVAYLKKDFFESKVNRLIVDFVTNYYEKYKSVPPTDAVLVELNFDETRSDWLDTDSLWPQAYLEDHLNAFIKNMSMKGAIEESIELLEDEDYGTIEKKIKDAVNVDIDTELGVTIDHDRESFNELYEMITSEEATISTGWENLDKVLDGGVTVPSLNYILAKSGGGKSIGLVNLSWNYVQMGKDVIYITLELKEAKVMKRYIQHSTKIPNHEIPNKEMEIFNHIKKCHKNGYGRFTVHYYQPNTLSSIKLELFIRNYIQKYGNVPVVVLDYAGLMTPNSTKWDGMFEKDKYISEELRGVMTLFDTICWTADQYNRCISIDEKVKTPNGYVDIGNITVGDQVLRSNNEWKTVLETSTIEEQVVYEIVMEDSDKKIMVSGRHIFPKDVNGRMVEDTIESSLKVGDKLYIEELF